jgi:tRNA-binding protein
MATPEITWDDFERIDMRAGIIVEVQPFERARRPTYKVLVDFGEEIGTKWSSVQAGAEYTDDEMLGRLVVAVVNFPPKNIAGVLSEVLILGVPAEDGSLSLLEPSRGARLGSRVY